MKPFVQRIKDQNEKLKSTASTEAPATHSSEETAIVGATAKPSDNSLVSETAEALAETTTDSTEGGSIQSDLIPDNTENKDNNENKENSESSEKDDLLDVRPSVESTTHLTTKEKELSDESVFDINRLTVGSWIISNLDGGQIKCKLAAKIASKDLYIFVDRQGKKIMQLSEQEILERVSKKELTMVTMEIQNEQLLASVISKNRTLKSDH